MGRLTTHRDDPSRPAQKTDRQAPLTVRLGRIVLLVAGLIAAWWVLVRVTGAPPYILPGPMDVATAWDTHATRILEHAGTTALEIALGLMIGVVGGGLAAMTLSAAPRTRAWLLPILVISQAIPVFALAPVLVLWLGYGLASKVAMAALIIFFPVTAALYDGLRRVEPVWVDSARVLGYRGTALLFRVRLPAALPAFATGLRTATAIAPIGAVVGEWVGSSAGLGYLMLHANARLQIDLMFAALSALAIMAVGLYAAVDLGLRWAMPWQTGEALSKS